MLHAVDADTHYSGARFIHEEYVEDFWEEFLYCWVTTYVDFPEVVKAAQGSVFTSKVWNNISANQGIAV